MELNNQFYIQAQELLDANPDVEVVYSTDDGNLFTKIDWAKDYARVRSQKIVEYRREPKEINANEVSGKNGKKK